MSRGKGLKITVNVAEDEELRGVIKDMIRGQVTSIVREELQTIVKEVTTAEINKVVATQLKPIVEAELRSMRAGYGTTNKLDTMIKEGIKDTVKPLTEEVLEERVYHKALIVLNRDNAALEQTCQKLVDKSMRGFLGKLAPS